MTDKFDVVSALKTASSPTRDPTTGKLSWTCLFTDFKIEKRYGPRSKETGFPILGAFCHPKAYIAWLKFLFSEGKISDTTQRRREKDFLAEFNSPVIAGKVEFLSKNYLKGYTLESYLEGENFSSPKDSDCQSNAETIEHWNEVWKKKNAEKEKERNEKQKTKKNLSVGILISHDGTEQEIDPNISTSALLGLVGGSSINTHNPCKDIFYMLRTVEPSDNKNCESRIFCMGTGKGKERKTNQRAGKMISEEFPNSFFQVTGDVAIIEKLKNEPLEVEEIETEELLAEHSKNAPQKVLPPSNKKRKNEEYEEVNEVEASYIKAMMKN